LPLKRESASYSLARWLVFLVQKFKRSRTGTVKLFTAVINRVS
jgi:hypothetical protein